MTTPPSPPATTPQGGLALIVALGITQIAGYGVMFYGFAVLAPAITAGFGWASEWTFGGFAVGLLAAGLFAPVAGHLNDRFGTRAVMSIGSLLCPVALWALSLSQGLVSFYAAMVATMMLAILVFYDSAFTALTQAYGAGARRAISKLTLIGGFSSTLFWPLTSALLQAYDWRTVYQIFAVGYLVVALPLHALLLPGRSRKAVSTPVAAAANAAPVAYLTGNARRRAFVLLALAFTLQGFVISAVSIHLITMLHGFGLAAAAAVTIGAMIGPSQVAGRLAEMLFGSNVSPVTTAWVSALLMPLGFVLLLAGSGAATVTGLFAIAYGISMGLGSIVRGTVPLQLFGPQGYGAMMGKIAAPGMVIRSSAPLAFAVMIERIGLVPGTIALGLMSGGAALALFLLARGVKAA